MNRSLHLAVPLLSAVLLVSMSLPLWGYDLEVPSDPWEDFRQQYKLYTRKLQKSFDRSFSHDYTGAVAEATAAIEILPDEGLAYAERAKLHLTLNNQKEADSDFRKALQLFERAMERYRKGPSSKQAAKSKTKASAGDVARLIATTRYQRGEAFLAFEQYRNAREDFEVACKGGIASACPRVVDVDQIQKRGANWVPLSPRQSYDRQRVIRPAAGLVRAWIRREELRSDIDDGGPVAQEHLVELRCETRDFKIVDGFAQSASGEKTPVAPDTGYSKPMPGNGVGKLLVMLCRRTEPK